MNSNTLSVRAQSAPAAATTAFPILIAISIVHLLNDTMQSTVSALFPILKDSLHLSYKQIGLIAFCMSMTASLLQPMVGRMADAHPRPRLLPAGVVFTLAGIVALSMAPNLGAILLAVIAIGIGSAVFHPESSRVAYMASGNRRGLAQSIFQVGGTIGNSLGPIMTAVLFVPLGQFGVIWFTVAASAGIVIQAYVAGWYRANIPMHAVAKREAPHAGRVAILPRNRVVGVVAILVFLLFSKYVYISSITSYYSFYMIHKFGLSVAHAQLLLFSFLFASAIGTLLGGPMADRYGRRNVIFFSIFGAAPFCLLMPHANLFGTGVLVVCAGLVLSSAFSIIVVYAQEMLPGNVGLISGLFFGLAFGLGGLGSGVLGWVADARGIEFVTQVCAFLPLLGVSALLLPKDRHTAKA
ncbi:MFS transporter [Cohnella zeiphila]|uniref:MFS transporter n=1 Tax=Cohnella zeiphila TaxID=2761120 RepID=A0A7X0SUG2_9BACL|nr:MFS transporter [Cohnella zeiphila]MBB6734088.1 MFS transporter [Cohnella zeiphila]